MPHTFLIKSYQMWSGKWFLILKWIYFAVTEFWFVFKLITVYLHMVFVLFVNSSPEKTERLLYLFNHSFIQFVWLLILAIDSRRQTILKWILKNFHYKYKNEKKQSSGMLHSKSPCLLLCFSNTLIRYIIVWYGLKNATSLNLSKGNS